MQSVMLWGRCQSGFHHCDDIPEIIAFKERKALLQPEIIWLCCPYVLVTHSCGQEIKRVMRSQGLNMPLRA